MWDHSGSLIGTGSRLFINRVKFFTGWRHLEPTVGGLQNGGGSFMLVVVAFNPGNTLGTPVGFKIKHRCLGLFLRDPDTTDPSEAKWSESHSAVSHSLQPHGLYSPWDSLGQNTGVGSLSLLQAIFPTQGLNPGLRPCRRLLHQLSHKGSPRILEWVAYSFSSRSSWPRNWIRVLCIAGGFFTNWATREVHNTS